MSDIIKLLSVNLDEVYCMKKDCKCMNLSADLYALSSKVEKCCTDMTIALSSVSASLSDISVSILDISASLSDIYEKIDSLSGKIDEISSQLSTEEKQPPTIFAYSTEDAQVTAMLRQKGVWNREPFPGYISSADTDLIMKLSAVMQFDFPRVAELENYNHSWDTETINVGGTNYCSYSEMQYEGIIIPEFEYSESLSLYVAEKNSQCLINTKTIQANVQSEVIDNDRIRLSAISSYIDPENLNDNDRIYVFGENNTWISYHPERNYTTVFGQPIVKDGKKYFGIEYTPAQYAIHIDVGDFKPNAESQYLSVGVTDSNMPGPFEYNGQYVYEVQLFTRFMDDPIPPTIYHI